MSEIYVGIRELKNNLSSYLKRVKSGGVIVITDRGKPIGQIVPHGIPVEERMNKLTAAGLMKWNGNHLKPIKPVAVNRSKKQVSDLLLDMRE